jgi:hypothetical protein
VYPIPSAASRISLGTDVNPAVKLRNRMSRVYAVSGIQAVMNDSPVIGRRTANAARLGIV